MNKSGRRLALLSFAYAALPINLLIALPFREYLHPTVFHGIVVQSLGSSLWMIGGWLVLRRATRNPWFVSQGMRLVRWLQARRATTHKQPSDLET